MRHNLKLLDGPFLARATPSGPTFVPTDVPNLRNWHVSTYGLYTVHDGTTPSVAEGDAIGRWEPKNVGGYVPVNTSHTWVPHLNLNQINGLPTVRGAVGADGEWLAVNAGGEAQPHSMFLVSKCVGVGGNQYLVAGGSTKGWAFSNQTASKYQMFVNNGTEIDVGVTADTSPAITYMYYNGATSRFAKNSKTSNQLSASPGTNTMGGLSFFSSLGGYYFANAHIAEFLWYTGTLSQANINSVMDYLSAKYAITLV